VAILNVYPNTHMYQFSKLRPRSVMAVVRRKDEASEGKGNAASSRHAIPFRRVNRVCASSTQSSLVNFQSFPNNRIATAFFSTTGA
jgi:hypothetical protein